MDTRIKTMFDDFIASLPLKPVMKSRVSADWLLVTCIDCRYPHVVHEFMHKTFPGKLYDQLILAGAALAATSAYTAREYWSKTFLEHVGLSIDMHGITGVLILDHRTCGAYREFKLLTTADENHPAEDAKHFDIASEAIILAVLEFRRRKHPGLVRAMLVPEVTDPAANDFPSDPVKLCEVLA